MNPRLSAESLSLAYGTRAVVHGVDLVVPEQAFTAIVGPNACGKSTLLRALARLMKPVAGSVLFDGRDIHCLPTVQVARVLGLLPQSQVVPEGLRVRDLVGRGRFPHQSFLKRWSDADEQAVRRAMHLAGVTSLADRSVDELSGGQRQRAWLATVLAQEPAVVLLDEPTTYLDLPHQLDVLDLCIDMKRQGRTVVVALHDLNLAARYATHMVAMRDGRIIASGTPADVITPEVIDETFDMACRIIDDPETGTPMVVPARRHRIVSAHVV